MRLLYKYILLSLFLYVLIVGAGYFITSLINLNLLFCDIIILSSVFASITIITLIIFFRGQTKEPDSRILHTLVAISLKFLLELVFALLWFIVAKKKSLPSVLIFFVIYLTFTLFSIWGILNTLRNKSLQN